MALTRNVINLATVFIEKNNIKYGDETLAIPANTTIAAGTILARDSVSLNLVPYVVGGTTNENGIPKFVIGTEVQNTTASAANFAVRVPLAAQCRRDLLIIQADGDNSNLTKAIEDQLRDYNFFVIDGENLSVLDN